MVGVLIATAATWCVGQSPVGNITGNFATLGANTFTGSQTLPAAGVLSWTGRTQMQALSNGYLLIGNSAGTAYSVLNVNVPGFSGFGTLPSVLGTVYMGSVNVGTGGVATSGSITFSSDGVANHFCTVTDNTHPAQNTTTSCVAGSTSIAFSTTSAWAANEVLTWTYTGSI